MANKKPIKNSNPRDDRSDRNERSSYRGKGNRNRNSAPRRDNSNRGEDRGSKTIKDAINDISWYAHNPQMLKDSASLPFNQMLGLPIHFGRIASTMDAEFTQKLPGLFILDTIPAFGSSDVNNPYPGQPDTPEAAINLAAQNIYSFVRHANSGHSNYDPVDLMTYILALDQAYSFHAYLVRAYGLTRFYSGYNRYLGKYLVDALGFDYNTIMPDLAKFRYIINNFAAKLCTFAVPAIMPIFERHRWIYSNVYMDRMSTRAQLYAFSPAYFGVYTEPVSASGVDYKSGIEAMEWTPTPKTLDDITNMINAMLNPLLSSEDIGIMSGDILKAYGAEHCYQINALSEDYILGPVYIEEVLHQIHNAVTIGHPQFHEQNGKKMMLYQDGTSPILGTWNTANFTIPWIGPVISGTPNSAITNTFVSLNPMLLDTNINSPTPEDVMIITRLMNRPTATLSGTVLNDGLVIGPDGQGFSAIQQSAWYGSITADAIMRFRVCDGNLSGYGYPQWTSVYTITFMVDDNPPTRSDTSRYRKSIADATRFDWHPTLYEYGFRSQDVGSSATDLDPANVSLRITADLDNCVAITAHQVNRIHDVALLSLLNVPSAVLTKGI